MPDKERIIEALGLAHDALGEVPTSGELDLADWHKRWDDVEALVGRLYDELAAVGRPA